MRRRWTVVVTTAVGALLAGCGSSSSPSSNSGGSNGIASQSASQILTAAAHALSSAGSVTVSGVIPSQSSTSVLIKNGTFFSTGDLDAALVIDGASAHLIKIGGTDYTNGSTAFWTANGVPAVDVAKISGIWISLPDTTLNVGHSLALSTFASHLLEGSSTFAKQGTTTVDGQQVVVLVSSAQHVTLYVATSGKPYPVEVKKTEGPNTGTLTFSNWNGGTEPTPPAGAKTLAQLGLAGPSGASGATGSASSVPSST